MESEVTLIMDLIDKLINNVLPTRYEDLPAVAVEAAKKSLLDCMKKFEKCIRYSLGPIPETRSHKML